MTGGEWMGGDDGVIPAYDRVENEAEVVQYCMEEHEVPVSPNPRNGSPQFPIPFIPYSAYPPSAQPSATSFLAAGMYTSADAYTHGRTRNMSFVKYDEEAPSAETRAVHRQLIFTTEVLQRMVLVSILGLGLQWLTMVLPFSSTSTLRRRGLAAAL